MKWYYPILLFYLFSFFQLHAQNIPNQIDTIDLKKHIYILSSDSLEGRKTGEPGIEKAAQYLKKQFTLNGINPMPNGSYEQVFKFITSNARNVELIVGDHHIVNYDEIIYEGKLCQTEAQEEIILIGTGTEGELKGLDLQGKSVLMFGRQNLERVLSLKDQLGYNSLLYTPTFLQAEYSESFESIYKNLGYWYGLNFDKPLGCTGKAFFNETTYSLLDDRAIIFSISPDIASLIMNLSIDELEENVSNNMNSADNKLIDLQTSTISYNIDIQVDTLKTKNIIGLLRSNQPSNQYLIFTAHYDHHGIIDEHLFPGADDNASGIAVMLELMESLTKAKENGLNIPVNLVFIATSGEELGLWGSDYYTNNSIFPLEKTIGNINLDMLGRVDEKNSDNRNYMYCLGLEGLSEKLGKYFNADTSEFKIIKKYKNFNDFHINASDHYFFMMHDIPSLMFYNGTHEDYHHTTDTPDKIDYSLLEKRAKIIYDGLLNLFNDY